MTRRPCNSGGVRPAVRKGVALHADVLVGPIILRKILNELSETPDDVPERLIDSLLKGWGVE